MRRDFFVLTKFYLSLAVSLSALFAYIMAKGEVDLTMLAVTFAVLIVSMGVSAINQAQEWQEDAKMPRTKNRPIASGRLGVMNGMLIGIGLVLLSFLAIYPIIGITGVTLFAFSLLWYNFVYTPLKKYSALAVIPGALLGAIPPAVGWIAAGHSLFEVEFIVLAVYYFIWQVPHFWLLVMKYDKDYDLGGFPTALGLFGERSLNRLTFVWIVLTIYIGAYLVYTFEVYTTTVIVLSVLVGLFAFISSLELLKKEFNPKMAMPLFMKVNMSFLLIVIFLSVDEVIKHHA